MHAESKQIHSRIHLPENDVEYLPCTTEDTELFAYYGSRLSELDSDSEKSYPPRLTSDDLEQKWLFLTFTTMWNIILTISNLLIFGIVAYREAYMKCQFTTSTLMVLLIIFHIVDTIDVLSQVTHYFMVKSTTTRIHPRRNILVLVLDIMSLSVFGIFIANWVEYTNAKAIGELCGAVYRMHRVANYVFYSMTASPLRQSLFYVIMKTSIMLAAVVHITACLWVVTVDLGDTTKTDRMHWTYIFHREQSNPLTLYLLCSYRALSAVAGIGVGGASYRNDPEFIIYIVLMVVNLFLLNGVFLGAFTSILQAKATRRSIFGARLSTIERQLNLYETISPELKKTVVDWYVHFWQKESGIHDCAMRRVLPSNLNREIEFDKYYYAISQSHILRFLHDGLKRALASHMITEYYNIGDKILIQDSVDHKIIFISYGTVNVLGPDDIESPIINLGFGSCIGDMSLFLNVTNTVHVVASSYCKAHVLHKTIFWRVVEQHYKLNQKPILFSTYKFIMDSAKLKHKTKSDTKDKPLKIVKRRLNTIFPSDNRLIPVIKKRLTEDDITDKYIMKKIGSVHRDAIFVNTTWPWILYPKSQLISIWELFICLLSAVVLVTYPYFLFFLKDRSIIYMKYLRPVATVFFIADVIMQCFIAVEDHQQNMVSDLSGIISYRFTKINFIIDIVSSLPTSYSNEIVECNHLLKFVRVLAFTNSLLKSFKYGKTITKVVLYVVFLTYLSYLLGLLYLIAACTKHPCPPDTWLYKYKNDLNPELDVDSESIIIILLSMLYGLIMLTGTGGRLYEDFDKFMELLVIATFCMSVIFLYSYLRADFSATLSLTKTVEQKYISDVTLMRRFMASNRINKLLINRMNIHLESYWNLTAGIRLHELLKDIPVKFIERINREKYFHLLKGIPMIRMMELKVFTKLCGKVVSEFYAPNEFVTYSGNQNEYIYIIEKGYCEISESGRVHKIIGPTRYFCDLETYLGLPTPFDIRTITNVSILRLSLSDLTSVMEPELLELFEKQVQVFQASILVGRVFMERGKTDETSDTKTETNESFFHFPKGKLHPLNIDYQKGWEGWNFLRYMMRRTTILPNGKFIYIYVIFHAVVVFISCVLNINQFVFTSVYNRLLITIFAFGIDLLLLIDVYIRLHVCYYNKDGILITHPRCTLFYYLSSSFTIDLITSLPIKFLFDLADTNYSVYLSFIKVIRVYRIPNAFAYYEKDILAQERISLNLIKYSILSLVFLTSFAAFLILIGCTYTIGVEKDTLEPLEKSWINTAHITDSFSMDKDSPYFPLQLFSLALYYTVQNSLQLAFGDIFVVQNIEILFLMAIIVSGYTWFTYILVKISNIKSTLNVKLTKYQNHMEDLIKFLKKLKVPRDVQSKSIQHFEYIWHRTEGTKTSKVLENLPTTLREDCILAMYLETLSYVPIFQKAEIHFFRALGLELTEAYFLQYDDIISVNDIMDSVYIIHRGSAKVYGAGNQLQTTLKRGSMFGNLDNVPFTRSMITITANYTVDILHMKTTSMYKLLESYQKIYKTLQNHIVTINLMYVKEELPQNDNWKRKASFVTEIKVKEQRTKLTKIELFYMSKQIKFFYMVFSFLSFLVVVYQTTFINETLPVLVVLYFFDFLHIVKVWLMFKTPYVNDLGEIVINTKEIKRNYIRTVSFYYDIIALVPLEIFYYAFREEEASYLILLRLNRCLRLLNVRKYFSVTYDRLNINVLFIKLSSLTVFSTTFIHTCICLCYIVSCPLTRCTPSCFMYKDDGTEKCKMKYICTAYYTASIITSASFGNLTPRSWISIFMFMLIGTVSKCTMTIFISNVVAVVRHRGYRLENYAEAIEMLKNYLANSRISRRLRKRTLSYLEQLWFCQAGRQMPIYFQIGSDSLIEEIKLHSFGMHIFNCVAFLPCHDDFLRLLTTKFELTIYFTNDIICRQGDVNNTMYFIHKGVVNCHLENDKVDMIVDILQAPDCFGLIQGIFPNSPHTHTYSAECVTEIVTLKFEDWMHLLTFFPASKFILYKHIRNYEYLLYQDIGKLKI